MKNDIYFSIICPLYNKEKYIKETIDSVLSQSYEGWELILVDDGSTDNSISIAENFICDKIRLIHRNNYTELGGGSVSRNIGIKFAKGSHIMFLDADDVLASDCLKDRNYFVSKHTDYDFYVFDIKHFINNTKNIKENKLLVNYKKISYYLSSRSRLYFLKKFLKYDSQWSICNIIWKKETLLHLNGFSENFQRLQDVELHTRALLDFDLSFKFLKYKTKPDVYVRSDPDRSSSITPIDTYLRVANSIKQYIKLSYPKIKDLNMPSLYKYLNAYILLFEQFYEGYKDRIKLNEYEILYKTRNQFYNDINFIINKRNKKTVEVYRYLSKFKILKKLRIPAIFVFLYKISLR